VSRQPVPVTGVWLRKTTSGLLEVLVETDGVWRLVVEEICDDGPISHIVEPAGILGAPADPRGEDGPR
jgi:hypothetical protein